MGALVPYGLQRGISPAGLRAAARQTQGIIRIPPRLQSAIAAFLGEYPTHDVKLSVLRLSEGMKNTKFALDRMEDTQDSTEEDTPSITSQKWQKKLYFRGQVFNKYRERDTAAYVAARMPAVYSAIHRVLLEVSRRLPDFKPYHIMDYGSGPGTAIWALCDVWPGDIERADIVEQSAAMSFARRSLFQGMKNLLPNIRNFDNLDEFARQVKPSDRAHNLVIASYSLGELHTAEERIHVARQLWGLTTDILILIEPGSQRGSNIVREIRSHILCMENKRLWRYKKEQHSKHSTTKHPEEKIGAFVVAPCAHNGVCPMDGTDKFCHFSQRLERSSSQLIYKRPKGRALRGYEDEKFSFVVLRKGSRPRMEWPLERVDQQAFKETKKNPNFYGVVIEVPDGFEDDDDDGHGNDNETKDNSDSSEDFEGNTTMNESDEENGEEDNDDNEVNESSNEEGSTENEQEEYLDEEDDNELVADIGSGWGRILFPPIRRGKRVVVDVCCSADRDGSKGMLERITITKRTNKFLHLQARRSRWGDLWPCGNLK